MKIKFIQYNHRAYAPMDSIYVEYLRSIKHLVSRFPNVAKITNDSFFDNDNNNDFNAIRNIKNTVEEQLTRKHGLTYPILTKENP